MTSRAVTPARVVAFATVESALLGAGVVVEERPGVWKDRATQSPSVEGR